MLHYWRKYKPSPKDKEVLRLRLDAFTYFFKARELVTIARDCKDPFRAQYLLIAQQMHNAARSKLRRIHEVTNYVCSDRLH